ncbi:hypothetical protein P7C70_g6139, partial [Phenoliferia sp. Uapishka_3]
MSSAQLKSLMSAKRTQARLTHPYAKYSGNRLSCSLCGASTSGLKEVQWSSHILSKGHRVNVRKVEAEAAKEAERAGKRAREEEDAGEAGGAGKRAREESDNGQEEQSASSALPDDFFADPSMAPPPRIEEDEDMEQEPTTAEAAPPEEDDEWAAFEATLANAPPPPTVAPSAGATIFSAPVRPLFSAACGAHGVIKANGAELRQVMYEFGAPKVAEEGEEEAVEEEEEDGETEEEKAERLEREEREEIMDRIQEEEREQMEADEKVNVSLLLIMIDYLQRRMISSAFFGRC